MFTCWHGCVPLRSGRASGDRFNWKATPQLVEPALLPARGDLTASPRFTLRVRAKAPRLSEAVFFLGCLFYGAGIWLVAQAFHIEAHVPMEFGGSLSGYCHLLFASTCFYVTYCLSRQPALWAGMEVLGFVYLSPRLLFGWCQGPMQSAVCCSDRCLDYCGRIAGAFCPVAVQALYVALLNWSLFSSVCLGVTPSGFLIGSIGAVLLILAEAHRPGNALAIPYRLWGVLFNCSRLIPLSSTLFCG